MRHDGRAPHNESISSMKMIAGEFFSASSKALRRFDSDSPGEAEAEGEG